MGEVILMSTHLTEAILMSTHLTEVILMSTHNIRFYGELTKIILQLSSNTHFICSTELIFDNKKEQLTVHVVDFVSFDGVANEISNP